MVEWFSLMVTNFKDNLETIIDIKEFTITKMVMFTKENGLMT